VGSHDLVPSSPCSRWLQTVQRRAPPLGERLAREGMAGVAGQRRAAFAPSCHSPRRELKLPYGCGSWREMPFTCAALHHRTTAPLHRHVDTRCTCAGTQCTGTDAAVRCAVHDARYAHEIPYLHDPPHQPGARLSLLRRGKEGGGGG
jgi:hypothetical protein